MAALNSNPIPPKTILRWTNDITDETWELAQGDILDSATEAVVVNTDQQLWTDRSRPYNTSVPKEKRWRFRAGFHTTTWAQIYGQKIPNPHPNVPVPNPSAGVPAATLENGPELRFDTARILPVGGYGSNPPSDPPNVLAKNQMQNVSVVIVTNFDTFPTYNRRDRLADVYERAIMQAVNPTQPPPALATAVTAAINSPWPLFPNSKSISFPPIGHASGEYPATYAAEDAVKNCWQAVRTHRPYGNEINHIVFVVPPKGPLNRRNELLKAYKTSWNRHVNPRMQGIAPGKGVRIPSWTRHSRWGRLRDDPPRPFPQDEIPAPRLLRRFDLRPLNNQARVKDIIGYRA